jgi:hypothetical protein
MTVSPVGWPFAVGLALVPQADVGREDADAESPRMATALAAYKAGFYLIDVVEVAACAGISAQAWARLWSLVRRLDAEAVFVLGLEAADREVLDSMADELRLIVRVVPAETAGSVERASHGRAGAGREPAG